MQPRHRKHIGLSYIPVISPLCTAIHFACNLNSNTDENAICPPNRITRGVAMDKHAALPSCSPMCSAALTQRQQAPQGLFRKSAFGPSLLSARRAAPGTTQWQCRRHRRHYADLRCQVLYLKGSTPDTLFGVTTNGCQYKFLVANLQRLITAILLMASTF